MARRTHLIRTALLLASVAPLSAFAQDELTDGNPPAPNATTTTRPATTQPSATHPTTEPATQPAVPGKLVLSTWAPTGFLKNPVALTFDRDGRCYVAQTMRREGGELQVRTDPAHRTIPDHTFQSIEDKFRWAGDGDAAWGAQTGGKKEIITRVEDAHHTGHADEAKTFFEGFNANGADILAGITWFEGAIYATCAPDLWMLRDKTGDGRADDVVSLSHGYGVHMSYSGHNMHGLCVGPDGKIYFTIGDKALNVTTREGRKLVYPYCGACLRCNPDGSDLEVFAYGLRNPQEVAFDRYGNLISADNDGDMPGERERLVYITEGSDTGWRFNWQYRTKNFDVAQPAEERADRYNPWIKEKLSVPYSPGQPAHITPALASYTDGPCGVKYATEGSLNDKYREHFFVVEFPKATIRAFALKPKGAAFTLSDDQIVSKGVQCTGLALAPDGAIYGAGWGNTGFKLGNTGTVQKLDDPTAANDPIRLETQKLLKEGPYKKSIDELVQLLGHADMRVRQDAQFELVRRDQFNVLSVALTRPGSPQMARIHGLWGLGQFVASRKLDAAKIAHLAGVLRATVADVDDEVRAQSAKLLGDVAKTYGPASVDPAPLRILLHDHSVRVRFFAAIALGKCQDRAATEDLLRLAADNRPVDPFIRHAIVMGLTGISDADVLAATIGNPSPDARVAAVVALRRLRSPRVANFLKDRDETVVTEAARAIHDDYSIPEALPALAAALERSDFTGEPFVRRALNANLRVGGREQVDRLVRYTADERRPAAMRVEAIDILANWETPVVNDRVEGWYRTWPQRSGFAVRAALETQLPALLASAEPTVAQAATQLVEKLGLKTDDAVFAGWVTDAGRAPASRVTALRLLANRKYSGIHRLLDEAMADKEPLLRIEALRVLADQDPAKAMPKIALALSEGTTVEKQAAFRLLGALKTPEAQAELVTWMDKLLAGDVPSEVQLDLLESAESYRKSKPLKEKLKAYNATLLAGDVLATFKPCLTGGDAERGAAIFNGNAEAACIRCHSTAADNSGSTVGPNLAGIGAKPDKPRTYLLESMILPSAYIVPGYGLSSFKLKDGAELSAQVRSETPTEIQTIDLEGKLHTIKASDVVTRTPPVSMMPAMGALLTRDEVRDVIEYLSSLKR